ncbi:MAG: methyl-accepting chemotaxis protein, partial [Sulfurimonadaceae bacterium]
MGKLSIKARLLFLITIPLLAVMILSVIILNKSFSEKENLQTARDRILETEALAKAIHFMQIERGLSVGYVASEGKKNGDAIPAMREKVNGAIEEIKGVYEKTGGDSSILDNLSELNQKRAAIDSHSISAPEVGAYFSKTIVSIIDNTTTIPSNIDIKKDRNTIQAYTHLASTKEQLGQMRANLNGAFTIDTFAGNTFVTFGGNIGAYKINLRKFTTLAPDEIRSFHENKYRGEVVDATMQMIDVAMQKGSTGGFGVDSSVWFKNVSASIELLREVELELFKFVLASNEQNTQNANNTILFVSASLVALILFIISFALFFIKISISAPINRFKETLTNIGNNKNLTLVVDENAPLELSQMARSFNNLMKELKDLIDTSKQSSSENASISHELSTTAMGVGENVEKSVVVIDEATKKANSIKNEI